MVWCGSIICQNMYESFTPTDRRFKYSYVQPAKQEFDKWDDLKFTSKTTRYKDIYIRREDTAYCSNENNWVMKKYPTQFRPKEDGFEYKTIWSQKNTLKYKFDIDNHENICKMCWTVIGKTPLWYIKTYDYCTEIFGVNK